MRITLAQVDSVLGDIDENVRRARDIIARQASAGVDLVVFPELFLSGYSIGSVPHDVAVEIGDDRIAALADAAGDTTAALIGFTERGTDGKRYNSAAFLQSGGVVHTHRKAHLASYDIWEEGSHFTPGGSVAAFDSSVGRVASLICYDLWDPGLALVAAHDGARMLLVPSNSIDRAFSDQASNQDQWRIMTRCYASLLQCYVVFVNRVGAESDLVFWGGSHVVDPHGRMVSEAPNDEEALVVAEIDVDDVDRRRSETPLVQDMRLDLVIRELERIVDEGSGQ